MTLIRKTTIVVLLATVCLSCNRLSPLSDGVVIARVGEAKLYDTDLKSLFSSGITPQDSVKLLESYIDMWVKKRLKIQQAENMFRESSADIEKMVEDYRNSLLSYKLDQYYVDRQLDTAYTQEAITEYYNTHRADFVLDRAIVKGRIVKLPEKDRQKKKLTELITGTGDRLVDFRDLCYKNGFELTEFNTWTDFGDFLTILPVSRNGDNDKLLRSRGVVEMREGDNTYLVYITERLGAGDTNPQDRVRDIITRVLFNQRRQDIIRSYEDSLLRSGLESHHVELKIN